MADEWFYVQDKKKMGPVPFTELQQLAAGGKIQPTDMVLQGGTTQWTAAQTVTGLFQAPADYMPEAPSEQELEENRAGFAAIVDEAPQRIKPHQGPLVFLIGALGLGAGLVGLFGQCCFFMFLPSVYALLIPAPVLALGLGASGWVQGGKHLKQMQANLMDPRGADQTRLGWLLGIVGTMLGIIGIIMYLTIVIFVGTTRSQT